MVDCVATAVWNGLPLPSHQEKVWPAHLNSNKSYAWWMQTKHGFAMLLQPFFFWQTWSAAGWHRPINWQTFCVCRRWRLCVREKGWVKGRIVLVLGVDVDLYSVWTLQRFKSSWVEGYSEMPKRCFIDNERLLLFFFVFFLICLRHRPVPRNRWAMGVLLKIPVHKFSLWTTNLFK